MAESAQIACIRMWQRSGRPEADLHTAALLAAALLGSVARDAGSFLPSDWAAANLAAQDPLSILNTTPALPPVSNTHG